MILYFDNYITDKSLNPGVPQRRDGARAGKARIYNMPSKLEINLYSLASYAAIEWSSVVVKYSIEDQDKVEYFETEVKKLFPNAIIIRGRSDNPEKFKESVNLLRSLKDEWIFYMGNSDYPFVAPETKTLTSCIKTAAEHKRNHRFVSVQLGQSVEYLGTVDKNSLRYDHKWKKIGEDEHSISALVQDGYFDAIQLVHIDLFEHWFYSKDLSEKKVRIFRSDALGTFVDVPEQVVVIPKNDICYHFDGYTHIMAHGYENPDTYMPPLFIPPGFFESKIKIAYGYDEYREDWVNINPQKKHYSFIESNGTDMKILLSRLPLFWKGRVSNIDINPNADEKKLQEAYERHMQEVRYYWRATPTKKANQISRKLIWLFSQNLPVWIMRFRKWSDDPRLLERTMDERERGIEGKLKFLAKHAAYKIILANRKLFKKGAGRALGGGQKEK